MTDTMTQYTREELAAVLDKLVDGNGVELIVKALSDVCGGRVQDALNGFGFSPTGHAVAAVWADAARNLGNLDVFSKDGRNEAR